MIKTVILDLSEVLILGMHGIEGVLARRLGIPDDGILRQLGGDVFLNLMRGKVSEDDYLRWVLETCGWPFEPAELKDLVRGNFHHEVPGTLGVVRDLPDHYELVLLTDHGREWMAYILTIHPFLARFDHILTSFDLGRLKADPGTFDVVLDTLDRAPEACLFVDDNPRNVEAARAAGIDGVVFESAAQLRRELVRRGLLDGCGPG